MHLNIQTISIVLQLWVQVAIALLFVHVLWRKAFPAKDDSSPDPLPALPPKPKPPKYQDFVQVVEFGPVVLHPDGRVTHKRAQKTFYYGSDLAIDEKIDGVRFFKKSDEPILQITTHGITLIFVYHEQNKFWRWWFPDNCQSQSKVPSASVQ